MDRIGILVVSKCLSAAAIIDALSRSQSYAPRFYVAEKQENPFVSVRATVHRVVPDLGVDEIVRLGRRYKDRISFAVTDTEDFVIAGGRDTLEAETGIPAVCVSKRYAIESSKADQRILFEKIFRDANPRFRVFDPRDFSNVSEMVSSFRAFASDLGRPVIKPDAPARGAGVGVWGSEFSTPSEMVDFFLSVSSKGRVVVEERIDGEESSFQAFSDGKHLVVAPQTRDYKRALDGGRGRLTGGMGSYRSSSDQLPFLRPSDWEHIVEAERVAFRRWKGRGSNPGLRGVVLYDALMHTGKGFKILERNSRGGNTEQINVLATMKSDFVEICMRMIEGRLTSIDFSPAASVVTCVVPREYGSGLAARSEERTVDLRTAQSLEASSKGSLRVYPMDLRDSGDGRLLMGTSRCAAIVGLGPTIEDARDASVRGAEAVRGEVRYRRDIATSEDLKQSEGHMASLRAAR